LPLPRSSACSLHVCGTRHQITQLCTAQLTVIEDARAKPNGGSRSSPMATTGYRFR
jgi:hypothetical protein